jgi:hypothetical protein
VPLKTKEVEKSDANKLIDYLEVLLPRYIETHKEYALNDDFSRGLAEGRIAAYERILVQIQEFREGKHFCQRG